jgi:regulator of protease activity HflC (stomatin/prohibitin superfamily)
MKENNINVYDEKNNNEKSEDVRLTNNLTNNEKEKRTEEYDKFKNRMASLFKEFEHDKNNLLKNQTSSAINFSERELDLINGCKFLLVILIIIIISIILIIIFIVVGEPCYFIIPVPALCLLVSLFLLCNLTTIPPGYALVLTYYGKYLGTCKNPGFYWTRPCSEKSLISLKSIQFNGNMIKVNDREGTPVLIGVVSVYHINDTVKATYGVKDSDGFMKAQTESAIRFIANKFSYDSNEENEPTLKSGSEEINELLKLELQRRTKMAGIEIEDARITEISYGNEIATLMLQKQAADAIINSKAKIAKGAVDIIDNSIKELEKRNVCKFNDDEKSKLVGNMMIVLNMDKGGNAIINCK